MNRQRIILGQLLAFLLLGSPYTAAEDRLDTASILFQDDLAEMEIETIEAADHIVIDGSEASPPPLRGNLESTTPTIKFDTDRPTADVGEDTGHGPPKRQLQRLPLSIDPGDPDESDERGTKPPTPAVKGAKAEEGERLDPSPARLSGISFPKVFADLELLQTQSQPARDLAADFLPRRDPYFGFAHFTEFSWAPSNLAHKTLYFEDEPLERHGYTHSPLLQPFISAVEFAKDGLAAPIRGVFDAPHKCHFLAGRARVGSSACPLTERIVPRRRR